MKSNLSLGQLDKVRQAVAIPGWGWRPGMRVWGGDRITEDTLGVTPGCIPDIADPTGATDGALLMLLGPGWTMGRTDAGRVRLFVSKYPGKAVLTLHEAATLAEACCLCAIDLGQWPGGSNV